MKYNFDEIINRDEYYSNKVNAMKKQYQCDDLIPLWVADTDFKTAQPIVDAVNNMAQHGIYGYSSRELDYNQSMIDWFTKQHNYTFNENLITYSPLVVTSISVIIQTLTKEDDAIIFNTPVYGPFDKITKLCNRKYIYNSLINNEGYYTIDFNKFEHEIIDNNVKLFILCNPHNPVGRCWSKEELSQLSNICIKHNVLIISDEIHCDLVYEPNKHIILASINKEIEANVITLVSPTKTFNLAGIQCSFIIANNETNHNLINEFFIRLNIKDNNIFSIPATIAAYTHGYEYVSQLKTYLNKNIDYVINYLNTNIPQIKVWKPEATYLLWLDISSFKMDNATFIDFMARQAKVCLIDGDVFVQDGTGYIRMNIATPQANLTKALDQIKEAIATLH